MVRVFIKGGVWKNSEDEILKAAVMKYGKQQWARVASLLNRKSAKQCKARWNEWLDPSVRKVEWSREEDEKLLHLAKLMPAQWRTIGPLVGGRTAVQCQERYEKLLDEAAAGEAGATGSENEGGVGTATGSGASTARRLRPGDIDPHPETKPARPDPIDMDEDEIEMLQEARARLANTQGKKAKRKAREKMLNEAKRLADLQKKRELKQAGLLSSAARTKARGGKRRRREIDFGVEIPFHKPAPAGFHSTATEDERADRLRAKRTKSVDFKKINEAQYKSREREAKNAQKREEARLRGLERTNMQLVVAEVSKKNDPIAARKRGALKMPAPVVTDKEMEKVAKLTREQRSETAALLSGSSGLATDALLGDYTSRPLPTPMRTPMTGSGVSSQEVIMREASNLRILQKGQTPLLGGENPELVVGDERTGDIPQIASTTTGAATPLIGGNATPMTATGESIANQTPMSTTGPRDELGINRPNTQHPGESEVSDEVSISATSFATSIGSRTMTIKEIAIAERRAAKRAKKELELALKNLPAPQFEYELAAPNAITDDDDDDLSSSKASAIAEKDAEEIEAEEIARLKKEAAKIYAERSSVMKRRDLPRPFGAVGKEVVIDCFDGGGLSESEKKAAALIGEEMLILLQHDAFSHPVLAGDDEIIEIEKKKKSKKDKKKQRKGESMKNVTSLPRIPDKPIEHITVNTLDIAKAMVTKEYETIIQEKRLLSSAKYGDYRSNDEFKDTLLDETIKECAQSASEHFYTPNGWISSSDSNASDRISSIQVEYHAIKETTKATCKNADKLASKLLIKNGGYIKRSDAIKQSILQMFAEFSNSETEGKVYNMLLSHETKGIQNRMKKLEDEIDQLEEREAASQTQYGELLLEKRRLLLLSDK